ncbi:hypothetical protein B0H14DRAFT_2591783 [Mycena olivaceomarginata]|nr:hypothetical protein B0H14DRAFT_2591783 [Mycena olivaceomarginata]
MHRPRRSTKWPLTTIELHTRRTQLSPIHICQHECTGPALNSTTSQRPSLQLEPRYTKPSEVHTAGDGPVALVASAICSRIEVDLSGDTPRSIRGYLGVGELRTISRGNSDMGLGLALGHPRPITLIADRAEDADKGENLVRFGSGYIADFEDIILVVSIPYLLWTFIYSEGSSTICSYAFFRRSIAYSAVEDTRPVSWIVRSRFQVPSLAATAT